MISVYGIVFIDIVYRCAVSLLPFTFNQKTDNFAAFVFIPVCAGRRTIMEII